MHNINFSSFSHIVVGAGMFGAVIAERIANVLGKKVLIVEKRGHIGGNCYSKIDEETGIEYHVYGTHIFHTNNRVVWDYINQFTEFNTYKHQVLSSHKGKIFQLPINLETINSFFDVNLRPYEVDAFIKEKVPVDISPDNFETKAISLLGKELYDAFIKGYTIKQWQVDPAMLDAAIFSRLPIRRNYDENYFYDRWQGIPLHGYTKMFHKMLDHPLITVLPDTDFFEIQKQLTADNIIVYSGPIDRYFDYKFGRLEWRTLRFEKEVMPYADYQGNAVINFPDLSTPYTRIHEPKHLHPERNTTQNKTIIFREYSLLDDGQEPYYPLLTPTNLALLQRYQSQAARLENVLICGRLGEFRYFDMDKTIERALDIFENSILN